ncbi:MAG: hypothetical protein M1829_002288 [Trizodia sp. TS-e1964]|nr:MAG: hypothetical protein M1829_002288 [Trizodia sp. TS-e1964]
MTLHLQSHPPFDFNAWRHSILHGITEQNISPPAAPEISPGSEFVIKKWLAELKQDRDGHLDFYPHQLISESSPESFLLGTGESILASIRPALENVKYELLIVTCFWAKSPSKTALCDILLNLSSKGISQGHRIRVRICLSSLSLVQKLFQTTSPDGYVYPPSAWVKNLGLPDPSYLRGLDLQIKSIFVRPFSVMHPKYMILDRRRVFLPSCNISWEEWFEGCVQFEGALVTELLSCWGRFWGRGPGWAFLQTPLTQQEASSNRTPEDLSLQSPASPDPEDLPRTLSCTLLSTGSIKTILLPSRHHRNPNFHPFPFQCAPTPPHTPLNTFILTLLSQAKATLYIQTPNLTSPPVLAGILAAVRRGVSVTVVISKRMQLLEQLLTAGTTTELCVCRLGKAVRQARRERMRRWRDMEQGAFALGALDISYYRPQQGEQTGEPVKSHLKLVAMDGEITVLGSGNMDRASWYTSQELGVAFVSAEFTDTVLKTVAKELEGRLERCVY